MPEVELLIEEGGVIVLILLIVAAWLWWALGARFVHLYSANPSVSVLWAKAGQPRFGYDGFLQRAAKDLFHNPDSHKEAVLYRFMVDKDRYSMLIRSLIVIAPLLGLLGTVSGMVETFKGLGQQSLFSQSGGVAGGIAEALLTTQIGLIVAAPAIIANRMLDKKSTKMAASLQSLLNHSAGR